MSNLLISALLALCPGNDTDHKGQTITDRCQERMMNCIVTKAWPNEPTQETFDSCAVAYRNSVRGGDKNVSSSDED